MSKLNLDIIFKLLENRKTTRLFQKGFYTITYDIHGARVQGDYEDVGFIPEGSESWYSEQSNGTFYKVKRGSFEVVVFKKSEV